MSTLETNSKTFGLLCTRVSRWKRFEYSEQSEQSIVCVLHILCLSRQEDCDRGLGELSCQRRWRSNWRRIAGVLPFTLQTAVGSCKAYCTPTPLNDYSEPKHTVYYHPSTAHLKGLQRIVLLINTWRSLSRGYKRGFKWRDTRAHCNHLRGGVVEAAVMWFPTDINSLLLLIVNFPFVALHAITASPISSTRHLRRGLTKNCPLDDLVPKESKRRVIPQSSMLSLPWR